MVNNHHTDEHNIGFQSLRYFKPLDELGWLRISWLRKTYRVYGNSQGTRLRAPGLEMGGDEKRDTFRSFLL